MNSNQKGVIKDILTLLVEARQNQDDVAFDNLLESFVIGLEKERVAEVKASVDSMEKRIEAKINSVINLLSLQLGNTIDYILIKGEARNLLLLDNAQMLRCKHGLHITGGLPDYEQYCIYSHYQFETLVNLVFIERYTSDSVIIDFVDRNTLPENTALSGKNKVTSISYSKKLFKLNELYPLRKYSTITNINRVRNGFLHRDGYSKNDNEIIKDYFAAGLNRKSTGSMTADEKIMKNNYYTAAFKKSANYQEVDESLQVTYQQISSLL